MGSRRVDAQIRLCDCRDFEGDLVEWELKMFEQRWCGRRFVIAATLTACIFGLPRLALAEDVEAIVSRGIELRRKGSDSEALAEFEKALELRETARARAQAGLAKQALGLWAPAESDLLSALSQTDDSWIKKNRTALTKALGVIQAHLGTLQLWGTPAGAAVFVDAKSVGTFPLRSPVRISGESVLVMVRADGFLETRRSVRVPAGETVREHIELVPVPANTAVGEPVKPLPNAVVNSEPRAARREVVTSMPPVEREQVATARDEPAPEESVSRTSALRPVAWVVGVAAVGALTFGVVETFARRRDKNAFNNFVLSDPADPGRMIRDYCNEQNLPPECRGLKSNFDRSNVLMIVGYAAAGALAIGSAVLFLVSSDRGGTSENESALRCIPSAAGSAGGLACSLVF